MKKTRKILIFVLSVMFAISAFSFVACAQKKEEMKITTVPPIVQHCVGESINLYDYIIREAGATYTFSVSYNGGEAKALNANGYYLAETGDYTFTVNGSSATKEGSATFSLSVVEVAPTIWYKTAEIPAYWLEYTILYKLLDEAGPYTMPVGGVTTELTHVFVYPAEDDTIGYKVDLTGTQSYVEKFNKETPDDLTKIELTDDNIDELGFYVNRKKRVDDTSPIKADDGKYYGVKDMQGIFMYLIEGQYEFHYRSYNTGGEQKAKFYVKCTEKLFELTELEGALQFDRDTEVASWAPIEGAVQYKVKLLNKNFFTTDTFFDCSQLITNPIMDYTIVVLPIGENPEKANDYLNNCKMTYETPYIGSEGAVQNADKSITIKGNNPVGGDLYGHMAAVENEYYALRGNYGIGNYIDVKFKGNNMPTIVLFADAINKSVTWHGGRGIVVMNGLVSYTEGGDLVKSYLDRTYVFGPNRVNTHFTHKPLAALSGNNTNLTQNYLKSNSNTTFTYTVGTRIDSSEMILLSSTLKNADTGEVISTQEYPLHYQYDASKSIKDISPTRYLTTDDVNPGSFILFGAYKENGEDTTILSVSDPYYVDPRSTVENEDGSFTVTSSRVVGTDWNALKTSNSKFGYVLQEGKFGVNTYAEYVFKGNNMPQILLFADKIDGNFTGNGGGKGILISNGMVSYTVDKDGNYVATNDTASLKIYGPNRIAGKPAFVKEDSAFSQDNLSKSSSAEYRMVVGTKVVYEDVNTYTPVKKSYIGKDGFMEEVVYVVLELYNNKTGRLIEKIETPVQSNENNYDKLARNKFVTTQDITAGSIVAFAGIKGVDATGKALTTTFFCSKAPETIAPSTSGHVHDFTNYNNDGTYHWFECTCGAKCTKGTCVGGTATCSELAVCDVCGKGHGELLPHVGGTATCTEKAVCTACGQSYGYFGHVFNAETANVQSNDDYHWFTCDKCGVVTEQMVHVGGEATYEDRAECEICGKPHGDYKAPESSDEVTLVNVTNTQGNLFKDKRTLTAQSGSITFDNALDDPIYTGQTAAIVLNEQFTDQFIKVSFTALDTVNETATNFQDAIGFSIGFRRQTSDVSVAINDWTISPWANTNYFYITNTASYLKAFSNATGAKHEIENKSFRSIVIGERYSLVFGITEEQNGDDVFHLMWLDENDNVLAYRVARQDYFDSKWAGVKTLEDSGYFTINAFAAERITLDYEIISEEDSHTVLGIHTFDIYEKIDEVYHSIECKCGEAGNNQVHSGGEATETSRAVCDFCGEEYGTVKQPIAEDVIVTGTINETANEFDGKTELTTESGSLTFSSKVDGLNWQKTSNINLCKEYSSEFIKIGFTALCDGQGEPLEGGKINYKVADAMGFVVGFKKAKVEESGNLVLSDWLLKFNNDANIGYLYNKPANSFALAAFATKLNTSGSFIDMVKGEQYYLTVGVVGQGDNSTIYLMLLDSDNQIMAGYSATMAQFKALRPDAEMPDKGYFAIGSYATEETTLTYEILSPAERCELLGIHEFNTYEYLDKRVHKVSCSVCGTETDNAAHVGGEATLTEKAVCDLCGEEYGNFKQPIAEDVAIFNMVDEYVEEFDGGRELTTESGKVTFTGTTGTNRDAATIVLKKQYANQFIKVGFTALCDGSSTACPAISWGLDVGVRGVETTSALTNWTMVGWTNTNYFYFCKDGANRSHFGGIGTRTGSTDFRSVKEGQQYYIVAGMTGTGENAVFHWMWLDANDNVLRTSTITAAEMAAKHPAGVIEDTGYFTIHSSATVERTITYEVLSDVERCELFGVHVFGEYTLVDKENHQATCKDCGEKFGDLIAHEGGTADCDTKAICEVCGEEYGEFEHKLDGEDSIQSNADYHWFTCGLCGEPSEQIKHFGGEATYEEQAKCEVCGQPHGEYKLFEGSEDVELLNVTNLKLDLFDGKRTPNLESGKITVNATTPSELNWQNTAVVGLKKQYTDEFIKIGFTALSGDGSKVNLYDAMGFAVGFRRTALAANPVLSDWMFKPNNDTNYGYFYNRAANAFAYGHGGVAMGAMANLKLVKGQQYYFVLGVTGTAPEAGVEDTRVMYAMWLDANNALIGGFNVPMKKFLTVRPSGSMSDSGYYTIHAYIDGVTLSYEVLSAKERCELLGIHDYATYAFVDDTYHALSCDCGANKGNETHQGGEATFTEKAVCDFCKQPYGTVKQAIADDVTLINMTNVTAIPAAGKEVIDTQEGTIKFTSTLASSGWGSENATVVLQKQYTSEFIKVGFTARSGDGTALNGYSAMGFGVGFRKAAVNSIATSTDWCVVGSDSGTYCVFYGNKAANAFHDGHGPTRHGTKTNLKFVEGQKYYFVVGVAGTVDGTTDNRTMYAIWLDANDNLIAGFSVPMTKFVSVRADATMPESGYFSINAFAVNEEMTLSYEIIDAATALGYVGK
ncbi:MAG: hypothetical protein IJC72_00410 [Clostridia bacterium]|nr:hypothetical protein [Clostridia bacterium]